MWYWSSTLELARIIAGEMIATDIDQDSLDYLDEKIKSMGLEKKVNPLNRSLFDLDFPDESFDIIWAEGSIFAIGFRRGLESWHYLIKDHGFIVVHDPYQNQNENLKAIEKSGYKLLDLFIISHQSCWSYFYQPFEKHIKNFQEQCKYNSEIKMALMEEENEIKMFKKNP